MPMTIAGVLLLLVGVVWILQGISVLPGSFMTGQTKWAIYGAIAAAAGIVLIVLARRGPPVSASTSSIHRRGALRGA
jgi:hypothetical protein